MRFEYDSAKSASNEEKHGIGFMEAQELWFDRDMVEFKLEHSGEQRHGILARLQDGIWLAVFVYRRDCVRIISVRRATKKEASFYDKTNNG